MDMAVLDIPISQIIKNKTTMKKTLKVMVILLCAVTMVMMSACSKSTNERRIVGDWVRTSSIESAYDTNGNLIYTEDHSQIAAGGVYRFRDDGFVINTNGEWEPYVIDGDKLVIGDGWTAWKYTIVELTNSTMVWERRIEWSNVQGNYTIYRMELEKR